MIDKTKIWILCIVVALVLGILAIFAALLVAEYRTNSQVLWSTNPTGITVYQGRMPVGTIILGFKEDGLVVWRVEPLPIDPNGGTGK